MFEDIIGEVEIKEEEIPTLICGYCSDYKSLNDRRNYGRCQQMGDVRGMFQKACQYYREID